MHVTCAVFKNSNNTVLYVQENYAPVKFFSLSPQQRFIKSIMSVPSYIVLSFSSMGGGRGALGDKLLPCSAFLSA